MTSLDKTVDAIGRIAAELPRLSREAACQYGAEVECIIGSGSRDVTRIERTLDGLLDFAADRDCLELFRRLCRHYWDIDPVATAGYVHAYREMRHITIETATIRNRLVADLATCVVVPHAAPDSKMAALCRDILATGKPLYTFDHPANAALLKDGAKAIHTNTEWKAVLKQRRAGTAWPEILPCCLLGKKGAWLIFVSHKEQAPWKRNARLWFSRSTGYAGFTTRNRKPGISRSSMWLASLLADLHRSAGLS